MPRTTGGLLMKARIRIWPSQAGHGCGSTSEDAGQSRAQRRREGLGGRAKSAGSPGLLHDGRARQEEADAPPFAPSASPYRSILARSLASHCRANSNARWKRG